MYTTCSSTRHQGSGTHDARQPKILGPQQRNWLVCCPFNKTLSMCQVLFHCTLTTQDCDTVALMFQYLPMPKLKTEDDLRQCALDMHHHATQKYEKDLGSPSPASLLETKNLANSIILDVARGTKFMCCDLKDCFPAAPICPTNTYQTTFDKNTNYKKRLVRVVTIAPSSLPSMKYLSSSQNLQ